MTDDESTGRTAAIAASASLSPNAPHFYLSTVCYHDECGSCRNTCKHCDAVCACPHHVATVQPLPEPWVDQARNIARELLRYGLSTSEAVPPELLRRISDDPALF